MAEQFVASEPAPYKPLVLIKAAEMRRRVGISRTQEYNLLRDDPDFPRPVRFGGSRYYVESEIENLIAGLIVERDAANGHDPQDDSAS